MLVEVLEEVVPFFSHLEGVLATADDKQNCSCSKEIRLLSNEGLFSPVEGVDSAICAYRSDCVDPAFTFLVRESLSVPKVNELDYAVYLVEHDVLSLQVEMDDSLRVHEVDALQDLAEEVTTDILRNSFLVNIVE